MEYQKIEQAITFLICHFLQAPEVKKELIEIFTDVMTASAAFNKKQEEENKFLSISEVANLFDVSKVTVHSWFKKGIIERVKIPGVKKTYIKQSQLIEVIKIIKPYQQTTKNVE